MNVHDSYVGLKRLGSRNGALLLVGHGTRSILGQHQLIELAQAMQNRCPDTPMQPCFLELAEPDIAASLQVLHARGISRLLIIPVLLFTAAHAKEDIPNAVAEYARKLGIELVGQSSSLNLHPQALALSQLRCLQACMPENDTDTLFSSIRDRFESNVDGSDSVRFPAADIALVMIGRGTSQIEARDAMRRFVELRCDRYPVAWSCVGFFAGDEVTVTNALDQAGRQSCSNTVVVQPHLLFEGELSQQLRELVVQYQSKYPEKRWLIAEPLGSDKRLSATYLSLAEEAVRASGGIE